MTIKPLQNYLLSLDSKYNETMVTKSGFKLFLDPTWKPEENATVTGKVVGTPPNSTLKNGDTVFFSYVVVAQRDFESTSDVFTPMFEGDSPYFQRYRNGKGETLNIKAMPGKVSHIWTGALWSSTNEFLDGMQGSEHELNRWKAKFNFGGNMKFKYRNLIPIQKRELWNCKPEYIFAKKTKKGLEAVGDRVILKPIDTPIPVEIQREMKIGVIDPTLSARYQDRATLVSGGKELGLKEGDIIGFDSRFNEKYDVDGQAYFLVKKKRILGTWHKR